MTASRLTLSQATEHTGLTERALKRLRQSRAIKFYRLGHRTVVYDRASLDQYLNRHAMEALR